MHYVHSLLRRTFAEKGFHGSTADRDAVIREFLRELRQVLTDRAIMHLGDERLASIFTDWAGHCRKLTSEQRVEALLEAAALNPIPCLLYRSTLEKRGQAPEEAVPGNVVALHAR